MWTQKWAGGRPSLAAGSSALGEDVAHRAGPTSSPSVPGQVLPWMLKRGTFRTIDNFDGLHSKVLVKMLLRFNKTDCLTASFYVSIKVISSKQSLRQSICLWSAGNPGRDCCPAEVYRGLVFRWPGRTWAGWAGVAQGGDSGAGSRAHGTAGRWEVVSSMPGTEH